jgi:hypothetical protein
MAVVSDLPNDPSRAQPFLDGVIFDLSDPAERSIVEFMQRFHLGQRGLYRVLAMRRVTVNKAGVSRRLVLQATRFQPQRRGARPEWEVLVWDIDGLGVQFLRRASRAAMLELYRWFDAPDIHC